MAFDYTFMDELIRTRKCTNTKKTRKKDEENTKETRKKHEILRVFRLMKEKISGLNWTTESKGAKGPDGIKGSKRAFGLVENQPHHFVPRWREA